MFGVHGLPQALMMKWAMLHSTVNNLVEQPKQHATAIPSRQNPFSSSQGSQTGFGSTSTQLSDRPGTLSPVVFMN